MKLLSIVSIFVMAMGIAGGTSPVASQRYVEACAALRSRPCCKQVDLVFMVFASADPSSLDWEDITSRVGTGDRRSDTTNGMAHSFLLCEHTIESHTTKLQEWLTFVVRDGTIAAVEIPARWKDQSPNKPLQDSVVPPHPER